jgi:epoxyqueuosine reductase
VPLVRQRHRRRGPGGRGTGSLRARPAAAVPAADELIALGRSAGLDAVGIAPAAPFTSTRRHLEERKAAGLHGGMAFTYRKPARSTDPDQALRDARALVVGARSYRRDDPPDGHPAGDGPDGPHGPAGESAGGRHGSGSSPAGESAGGPDGSDDPGGPVAGERPQGRVARYAWTDHYRELRAALGAVADRLRADGWRTRVLADDNALVDREAARRAGIGWYGKNANLLLPGQGSWFVLGSVVTDAPLPPTSPDDLVPDGCGTCTRCLDGCPTGAIVAPGVVDARRCLAWLLQLDGPFPREHRVALGDRIYGCDDCQEVCPPNRRTDRHTPAPAAEPGSEARVDVLDMLAASDDELLARHGRWYVPRRQPRYLRRNALVVLGNVADPHDGAAVAALERALADDDPLVRSHAVWAARRLGRDDLLGAVAADTDPQVRAELSAPVSSGPT